MYIDKDFAIKIENYSLAFADNYISVQKKKIPHLAARSINIADGKVFIYQDAPSDSKAIGLGLNRPVTEEEIEYLEELFASENLPAQLLYCPFADPTLGQILSKRGWHIYEWTQTLVYDLKKQIEEKTYPEMKIKKVNNNKDAESWIQVIAEGFNSLEPKWAAPPEKFITYTSIDSVNCYLATVQDELAAACALLFQDNFAVMLLASTREQFRGMGIHKAFLIHRLCEAVDQECKFALHVCSLGSISHTNAIKIGFTPAYCRPIMRKD